MSVVNRSYVSGLGSEPLAYGNENLSVGLVPDESVASSEKASAPVFPCSLMQRQLWLLDKITPGDSSLNVAMRWQLDGRVTPGLLEQAFSRVIDRHEVFRTRFIEIDGEPYQEVRPSVGFRVAFTDLTALSEPEQSAEAERIGRKEASKSFRLTEAPLLRVRLLRLSETRHMLFVTAHHMVFDGWSIGVLSREVGEICRALDEGRPPALPPLPLQFSDYARWQRAWIESDAVKELDDYWTQQLAEFKYFEVPPDHRRPPIRSIKGNIVSTLLPRALSNAVQELGGRCEATLYVTMLAGLMAMLHRLTGETDVSIGTQVAGRYEVELEDLIGCFVNTLVLRGDLKGDPSFVDLLARSREMVQGALDHGEMPTERLIDIVRPTRDLGRNPLFSINFLFQRAFTQSADYGAFKLTGVPAYSPGAIYDLVFFMVERPEGWRISCEYNTDLFEAETVERFLAYFRRTLEGVVENPDKPISELSLLTETELRKITIEWNRTETSYPKNTTVHELFESQAKRTPDAVAVILEDRRLTYRELNERANQLAHVLTAHGVGPDILVGAHFHRSLEMLIAFLGVLKAGGGYVPLNPSDPAERLKFVLEDTCARLILTQEQLRPESASIASGQKIICLDTDWATVAQASKENPKSVAGPQSLAYVMYTSGSTGQPKGVMVEHRAVVRLVRDTDYCRFAADEVFLQLAPISFDASTFEIWGAFLNGGQLVVTPPQAPSLEDLARVIRDQSVTTLWLTAGLFHVMVEQQLEGLRPLRQLLAGGDVLSPWHVRQVLEKCPGLRLINGYGPTENTTFTCCHTFVSAERVPDPVPIGRPISNTRVYILDAALQPVPVGRAGELFIAGDGLARGYLNSPELTETKFTTYVRLDGQVERLYRTGDQVRFLSDGVIQFLGRTDNQVKLRGYRIELDEIEAVLRQHPSVRQACVVAEREGTSVRRLVAYCVPAEQTDLSETELHEHLRAILPQYMLPEAIIALDTLPLTTNGKVDRDKLPSLEEARRGQGQSIVQRIFQGSKTGQDAVLVPPRNEYETLLAEIWRDVFRVPAVSVHDDFFSLGGNSLLAAKFISRLAKESGISIDLSTVIIAPTIAELATKIRLAHEGEANSLIISLRKGDRKPPLFLVHPGGGHLFHYLDLLKALPEDQPVYGVRPPDVDTLRHFLSVDRLASIYVDELQKIQSHGPYQIGGMSFGGLLAYEMASQLVGKGKEVSIVALFDTANPEVYGRVPVSRLGRSWMAFFASRYDKYLGRLFRGQFSEVALDVRISMRTRAKLFLWRTVRLACVLIGRPVPRSMHNMLDTFTALNNSYKPKMFSGRLVLFRAGDRQSKPDDDPTLGWGDVVQGGVKIHDVPGGHISMMRPPNVSHLAEQLKAYLVDAPAPEAQV